MTFYHASAPRPGVQPSETWNLPAFLKRGRAWLPHEALRRAPLRRVPARSRKAGPLCGRRIGPSSQGLGCGQSPRVFGVPRHLRHRDEPPRLQDSVQDPERRSAHPGGALLHAVGRHGGRAAQARSAHRVARERPSAVGLRRGGALAAIRAHLHQLPDLARSGRDSAARQRPRRSRSVGHRRRPHRDPPRTHRSVLRCHRGGRR
jgi:hypothetical protein